MRLKTITLLSVLLANTPLTLNAAPITLSSLPSSTSNTGEGSKPKGMFSQTTLAFLYSYTDFSFDSTIDNNYNRFKGHSNLYALGGDNVQLIRDVTAGVFVFKADTSVNSNVFLSPTFPSDTTLTNHNYTLFGHLLKRFNSNYYFDLSGAVGQNKATSQTILAANTTDTQYGSANSRSGSWFVSAAGIYTKPVKRFVVSANARILYSQVNADAYTIAFQPTFPAAVSAPLVNKVLFLMENAELGYKYKPNVIPFVNAGLIQVPHYSNSRPSIITPINGSLPQLNMNKAGYRLGGGIAFSYKKLGIRIEEQYYNAGGSYTSYQTLVGFKYAMA